MKDELVLRFADDTVLASTALTEILLLRELTSGFCYIDKEGKKTAQIIGKSKLDELEATGKKRLVRHVDLFSGICGFALAAKEVWRNRYEPLVFCDNDDFCQRLIAKQFPGIPIKNDVRDIKGDEYGTVDILTGGFPCQPYSLAGSQRGNQDDRALWPEMFRIIRTGMPRWVIAENVYGLITNADGMVFEQVCLDLESIGYDVGAFVIPACAVDAQHRRDRVWIVGNSERSGLHGIEWGGGKAAARGQMSGYGRHRNRSRQDRTLRG